MRVFALLLCGACVANAASAAEPVAVLELFTSEGCSSCPPAERLLPQLATQDPRNAAGDERHAAGGRVIYMEWHVDYWDHLGWKDPFDSHEATLRQQAYARAMQSDQLYTPQLVVNGVRACVGSNRAEAGSALREALAHPAQAGLTLSARVEHGFVRVDYSLDAPHPDAVLGIGLLSPKETMRVGAGENAGQALSHANVVLVWREAPLATATSGRRRIALPRGYDGRKLRVVGTVQDAASRAILGASLESSPR
jgi:hypothetical protein